MAFNPFHTFRKHQRPLIAVLAVFCMVLFIVQIGFGRADPVNQVLGWFGGGRGRGNLVATLHGRKVTEGDLNRLRRDRELASTFLKAIARTGAQQKIFELAKALTANRDTRDPSQSNQEITQLVTIWRGIYSGQFRLDQKQYYEFALQGLQRVRQERMRLSFGNNSNPEDIRSMDQLARVFTFEVWENDPRRNPKEFYFGGTSDTADLLDFILWEQQADRLGVVLTEADMITAINHEGADQGVVTGPTLGGDPMVLSFLSSNSPMRGTTVASLVQSLTREFRYVLAQEAVLGTEGGVRSIRDGAVPQVPAAGTPREFLNWFRDQRTTVKLAMLPVPVQRFVDQIKEKPSEATLKTLYEQYKRDEPAPDRELPGFKEPRRVRVETVTGRSDSPFYQQAARAQIVASMVGGVFGGPFGGPVAASWPAACDPLWREYEVYEGGVRSYLPKGIGVGVDLTDRRPMYAAVAGLTIGATPGALLGAATAAATENTFYNVGIAKVAGSVLPAGAGSMPLAAIGLPFPYQTTVLPPEAVQASLFAKVVEAEAPRLLTKNLDEMATEILKLKNRPEEAKAYISKAIKDFGLSHTLMAQPKTMYQLDDDPAIQPLRQVVDTEEAIAAVGRETAPEDVARIVTNGVGVLDPQRFPASRWTVVKEPYLWWRVEDLPARELPFERVIGQVEAAWKFEKARALAREQANLLERKVKENVAANKSAAEAVKVLRSFGVEFELDNVARLLPEITAQPGMGQLYRPYVVPHDRIPYPRPDFVDRMMSLKEPGSVTVVRDKGSTTFYVAVLEERSEPTMAAFLEEYRNADKRASLWQMYFMPDLRRAYVREVEKQMRIDATGGKVDDQGNIILPEGIVRSSETDTGE